MEMLKPPVPAALSFGLLTLSSPSLHVRGELSSQSRQDGGVLVLGDLGF